MKNALGVKNGGGVGYAQPTSGLDWFARACVVEQRLASLLSVSRS